MNVVPITEPQEQPEFDDFWVLYPRREAKKDAKKMWERMTVAQQLDACIALMDWRKVFLARQSNQYIPLPATWLNGERWEDELPPEFRPRQSLPVTTAPLNLAPRVAMPDRLKQLIAGLKKGIA